VADPGFSFGGQVESIQALRRVGFKEGVSSSPEGVSPSPMGRDLCPSPEIFGFLPQNGAFCLHSDT